ncbi:hypothetical protein cyc_05262 [Cyclospora cayetanensis]|uniref:Uncharacterized protein n=1 Tax=Cyclospora cayetanensis TaxID=88456 RepID=A0A1D3CRI3_9EIME|nr:hypothetical protein cyc_05262 [Cyclospora cayetanensis]
MLHPRASASETGNRDAVSESPRSASHRRISAPAAAATSAALPETVSLQQLQQLQQDVWAAEAEAKQRVLKLLKEGEAQFHELQSSLQQQQQQSHQASVHVLQLQQKLVGNGSREDSLACRLQKSENQQLLLRQQLSVIQEVEGFVLQLQLAQKQLAFFRELLKKQLLVEAAASLQIFAHALLLPLLAATRDTKPLPAIRELQQQFIEVHKQLVLSLDSRLRQHLQVSSQQITLTPVLHCSSISRSPDAAAAEATAGELSSGSGNACGTVSRLTDVWKSLHHLGLLHRRLYFITQQINKCVLQPLLSAFARSSGNCRVTATVTSHDQAPYMACRSFTWKWTADREKAFDSEGTAEKSTSAAAETPAAPAVLQALQSLLQYICDFAAEEHVECRRMWGKILWNFLEQPLLELLLHSRTEHFLLRVEAAAADAVAGGSASTASAAVLATDASIPGGMHDILMVQRLTNQEQQTQRLQLLQCIAEETDIALLATALSICNLFLMLRFLDSHAAAAMTAAPGVDMSAPALSDSLPIFDGYPDASMAAACGVSTAARDPATTAKQQQAEVPFRQQIAELVVALKQQQETIFVNMLKGLQKELQTASNELHELLKTATRSSTRLETHLEAAAGILTQRLNNAALDLLPILPIQVYAEVVGLAADCLIDCVLRTVLSAALAAVPGVRTTMSLHLSSRQQLRPEAAAQADAASASDWSVVLQRLAGGEDRGIAADVSAQRQQDEKQGAQCATAHASVRVEQFSSLLRVAVALQQVLEADVLLLLQHAATHAALLRQTFRPVEHRLALIALNPFIGAAPLGARREVFLSVAAVGNVHLSDCVVPSGG